MKPDYNPQVRLFIEEKVKQDRSKAADRRAIITDVINQVQQSISSSCNVQYLGSSYEGNATKHSSDYDATFNIAPRGSEFQVESIAGSPGYVKLRHIRGADHFFVSTFVTTAGYLSSKAVVQKLVQSSVDKLIGVHDHGGHLYSHGKKIKTNRSVHGPAVTIHMQWEGHNAQLDVVASVDRNHVLGGKGADYVSKPHKDSEPSYDDDQWRQSFAAEQKDAFRGVDEGNQVHREVVKIIKTVIKEDTDLFDMPSYVVKTAALILIHKDNQRISLGAAPKKWDSDHTADRVLDVGKEMYSGLLKGDMKVPNNGSENILSRTSFGQRERWMRAIGHDGNGLLDKIVNS